MHGIVAFLHDRSIVDIDHVICAEEAYRAHRGVLTTSKDVA
jgi:hypothetical protein